MKAFGIVLSFAAAASAVHPLTIKSHFGQFKQDHGKVYASKVEEMYRMKVFADNVEKIDKHNDEAAKGLHSYTMGINQFTDLTDEEFRDTYLGGFVPRRSKASRSLSLDASEVYTDQVNWVTKGYVTNPKNQGNCPSCWTFGAVGAIEGAVVGAGGALESLSTQDLLDCVPESNGCNGGGHFYYAFQYAMMNGIDTEKQYPYFSGTTGQAGQCKHQPAKVKVTNLVMVPQGENNVANALAENGPMAIGIYADPLKSYFGGIFDGDCIGDSNHAVLLVGYGSESGVDYWLIKNSWGEGYGENGYFRLARNANNKCNVADDAEYVTVQLS